MRNSHSQVPHKTETADVELARRIMKKKEMKAWWGDICHCLVIEPSLLANYASCSDWFTPSEGTETFHFNLKKKYFERKEPKTGRITVNLVEGLRRPGALVRCACRVLTQNVRHRFAVRGCALGHTCFSTKRTSGQISTRGLLFLT